MPEPLAQRRTSPADIFPRPEPDEVLETTPPAFNWLPVPEADSYRVLVEDALGQTVLDVTTRRNALLLREALKPGAYRWDIEAQGRRRGWRSFQIAADALEHVPPTARQVLQAIPDRHPRHIYYPDDLPEVREAHPQALETLARNIDLAIDNGLPSRPDFHRQPDAASRRLAYRAKFGGPHRDAVDRDLVACALGHLLLCDARAADHARRAILEICDWNPEGPCAVDGPWGDEIGLSHARCLPAVFDWTWDLFDDAERSYVQHTIAIYARQILRRLRKIDFFSHPGNSHCGRIPAYLAEAAMVLKGFVDDAEAEEWLQYALDIYASFFPFYGGRDGGWAEGVFYGSSYVKWYLPFFLALERHTGFSFLHRPFYRRVSQFFMHFAPPGWEIHPFCDGYWCLPDDDEWPGFFAQNPFRVYAERFGPPLARRFLEELPPPDHYKLHLLDIFTRPVDTPKHLDAGPADHSRAFRDAGFVSIHSDLEHPADDTALLARASKFGTASHQHADQGNFAVVSRGRGLISPSGYFGAHYGTGHHSQWTKQTRAHNCILVNDEGQQANSHAAVGRIEFLRERVRWAATRLDLAAAYPMLRSYARLLVMVRPGLILVLDDIACDAPVGIAWLAHTLSPPDIEAAGITVRRDPARMHMQLYSAEGAMAPPALSDRFETETNDGVPTQYHVQRRPQYHLRWDARPATHRRLAAVIAVGDAAPEVEWASGALRIEYAGAQMDIALDGGGPFVRLDGEAID